MGEICSKRAPLAKTEEVHGKECDDREVLAPSPPVDEAGSASGSTTTHEQSEPNMEQVAGAVRPPVAPSTTMVKIAVGLNGHEIPMEIESNASFNSILDHVHLAFDAPADTIVRLSALESIIDSVDALLSAHAQQATICAIFQETASFAGKWAIRDPQRGDYLYKFEAPQAGILQGSHFNRNYRSFIGHTTGRIIGNCVSFTVNSAWMEAKLEYVDGKWAMVEGEWWLLDQQGVKGPRRGTFTGIHRGCGSCDSDSDSCESWMGY